VITYSSESEIASSLQYLVYIFLRSSSQIAGQSQSAHVEFPTEKNFEEGFYWFSFACNSSETSAAIISRSLTSTIRDPSVTFLTLIATLSSLK
jgi:hypothetical protein